MENLTSKQRLTIYKRMLIEIEKYQAFCSIAKSACAELGHPYNTFAGRPIEDYLPELMAYKPAKICQTGYWFEGPGVKSQRTAILQEIIKKLEIPKIKSVILADEFNNGLAKAKIGTPVEFHKHGLYYIEGTGIRFPFSEEQIRENAVGLFDIKYEPEEFEFNTVNRIHYAGTSYYDKYIFKELNRLFDWCEEQCKGDVYHYMITYDESANFNINRYSLNTIHQGLKFNSYKSAELFITELNKPANKDYKNYFIDLLKNPKL